MPRNRHRCVRRIAAQEPSARGCRNCAYTGCATAHRRSTGHPRSLQVVAGRRNGTRQNHPLANNEPGPPGCSRRDRHPNAGAAGQQFAGMAGWLPRSRDNCDVTGVSLFAGASRCLSRRCGATIRSNVTGAVSDASPAHATVRDLLYFVICTIPLTGVLMDRGLSGFRHLAERAGV